MNFSATLVLKTHEGQAQNFRANTITYEEKYNHFIGRNTNKWWQAGGLERGGTCQDFTSVGLCPTLGCNEFIFYSIFIWLTLFSLYFSILRTICFLTFFDSRPPSFAKLTFCRFKFSKEAVGTKFGYFLSEYFLGTNCMPL